MTDLSDINMEGVKPMGETLELPVGQYLVRIEDTEKTATKEKFDEAGNKMPQGYFLSVIQKVYGGPHDDQIEVARLNLWNSNPTAVNMAKSELKSIQEATGVVSSNSDHLHGKWMILEIVPGKKDPTKLFKQYHKADPALLAAFAHVPPVPAKAPSPAASPAPAAQYTHAAAAPSPAAAPVSAAGDLPDWAKPKK